jgi:Glycosyl hydrolase family 81 C-terminal domain
MHSSVTKGMPYATMRYETIRKVGHHEPILPTIAAEVLLAKSPIADEHNTVECTASGKKPQPFLVERDVEVFFKRSDFTWLIFVSEPVRMQCVLDDNGMMRLQVTDWNEDLEVERDLILRMALSKKCTSGVNPIFCHQERLHPTALMLGQGHYDSQLRTHANFFSGPNTSFNFYFANETTSVMVFDWDVQDMSTVALHPVQSNTSNLSLIAFALPHHFDIIAQRPPADHDIYCVATLTGPGCLYEGSVWELREDIPDIGFRASRPPAPWAIGSISDSLKLDMNYSLPAFYRRGAGDTYFSGKMLAKLGRILLVAEELIDICTNSKDPDYIDACKDRSLPSKAEMANAVSTLRSSVEVWINGTAEIPFVYDSAWGGVVSCGCDFDGDKEICKNKFPDCTGFYDPGLNFGVSESL